MELNKLYYKLVSHSQDILCAIGLDGCFIKVSDACRRMLGYDAQEMEGRAFVEFLHPDDIVSANSDFLQSLSDEGTRNLENRFLHKDGHAVPLYWRFTHSKDDGLIICTASDAAAAPKLRQKVYEKEAFYQTLIEHGSDMLALLDQDGTFQFVNEAINRILGYQSQQLLCGNACRLIHPDDIVAVQQAWDRIGSQELAKLKDLRLKKADGNWCWVEVIVNNQLHNPAIRALVISARDITERKTGRLKLEESEQRYRALFENNPDIVIFENWEGVVTEVNPAFRKTFGVASDKIIGKSIASLLPPDMAAVNERSRQEALLGSTLRYDLEFVSHTNKAMVLDTVKFPVPAGDRVIGVQTIAKDITPIVRSFETIERQARKLNTIFESITDAFFTLDKAWRYTYINSEFKRITGATEQDYVGKQLLDKTAYGTEGIFYQQYLHAAETGHSVHFEGYSKRLNKWLEVKAFPSDEGLAVYFTDVTEKVKAKKEIEKLSLVASKTDNGVVITDADGLTEWVNEGFTKITGYTLADMLGKKPGDVLQGADTEQDALGQISEGLRKGAHFNAKLVNYRKSGEKFWMSMDITPIHDDAGAITQYIAIQRDISYQIETEANLLQLTQHLYSQNKDLQEFTYIVSHNLRAPAANALGLAHLLRKSDRHTDTFDTTLAYLQTSLLKMDTVLKDVSTVLSVRERQDMVDVEWVRLVDVFQQAEAQFQEPLLRYKCEVTVDADPELEVRASRAYLFSIFYNLLSNAIKYRSEERPLHIRLDCSQKLNGNLVIYFADNGTGFDTRKAGEDIFKLYKRFHKGIKGRGMGLFLVKAHIEAMGWRVKVTSKVGEGTRFLIHIPKPELL